MNGTKKNYFRIRRVAAAELERLHAAGVMVHPDAIDWAAEALASKDDVGGREPTVDRADILALLAKYPTTGLTIEAVAKHFGDTEKRIGAALYVLRRYGQVQSVKHIGRLYYFPSRAALDAQRERFAKERAAVELKQAVARNAAVKERREARAAAEGLGSRVSPAVKEPPPAPAPTPRAVEPPAKASAPPPAMRAAPSIATPAKRPVEIVDHPRGVKRTVQTTPLALIDRFGVGPDADPGAVTPGGFREEFQRLRAGGAEA